MRKMIFLGVFLSLLLPSLPAQIETGTIMLGGNSGFGASSSGFHFNLNPRVGYFLAPDFVVGAQVNASSGLFVDDNTTNFNFDYDLGFFLRYYLSPGKQWRPYLHAEIDNRPSLFQFDGAAGAGIAYFFSPRVSVETQLLFRVGNLFHIPNFSVSGLNVGVHVFFPPKPKE